MKKQISVIFVLLLLVLTSHSQIPNYLPQNGLVGWWPFNGNANDESGNQNNGIVINSILCEDRFGIQGAAYDFNSPNGDEKYIRCLNNETFNFNNYTISAWFKIDDSFISNEEGPDDQGGGIIQKGCDSNFCGSSYRVYVHTPFGLVSDNWVNNDCFSRVYVDTTINSTLYIWNHVVTTYDGITNKLFINGVLINESLQSGQLSQNENDLIFGGWFHSPNGECNFTGSFSGKIDDIGMWNRCLSNDEVEKLFVTTNLINSYYEVEDENSSSIDVFPNPTTDVINVDLSDLTDYSGQKLRIMNLSGQIVYEENVNQSKVVIDVKSLLSSGIYVLNTVDRNGTITSTNKFVVQ
jgi:hypothetical protein